MSLIEFLYRQAKQHEEKQKLIDKEKEGLMVIGKKKKKKMREKTQATYVRELQHINEDITPYRDMSAKPVSFENLLQDSSSKNVLNPFQLTRVSFFFFSKTHFQRSI